MKILAKIPRLHKDRSQLVEMDLFDTERNPLEFPSGSGPAPIPYLLANKPVPLDTTVPPWKPVDWAGITLDWPNISYSISDSDVVMASHPDSETIRIERPGLYLVKTVVSYALSYDGSPPSFDTMMDLQCNFGKGDIGGGAGFGEIRLGGQQHLMYLDHILEANPTIVFDFSVPIVIPNTTDLKWWLHMSPTYWDPSFSGGLWAQPVVVPWGAGQSMAVVQIYRLGDYASAVDIV